MYVTAVWLHILAAMVWVGGLVFIGVVLVPLSRRPEFEDLAGPLLTHSMEKFRWVGWTALGVLILSGTHLLGMRGYEWSDLWSGSLWRGSFGTTLAYKLSIVLIMVAVNAVHDFIIGPRAVARWDDDSSMDRNDGWGRWAGWLGRLTLVFSVVIVLLAVMLVRGGIG